MLEEALEHLIRGIVDHPDDVIVKVRNRQRDSRGGGRYARESKAFEVAVHQDDLGRVIGRNGRTATALRVVLQALAPGKHIRIDFLDADER